MAHDIIINGERQPWDEVAQFGPCERPRLRLHRLANGDALVITSDRTTRDGLPLLGNLAVIAWGTGARLRCGSFSAEIVWQSRNEAHTAARATRCRLCFGAIAAGETVVRCACAALLHLECDAVRVTCPGCGLPRQVDSA
jgi:hypothetical protein